MSLDFYINDTGLATRSEFRLFWKNYTHNVTPMWHKAKIYDELYNSDGKHPKEIMEKLRLGLKDMQDNRKEYKILDPDNGWGDCDSAMAFLSDIIDACSRFPEGTIHISK